MPNPYAHPNTAPGLAPGVSQSAWGSRPRFAVPGVRLDPEWTDAMSTPPVPGGSPTGIPDSLRIGTRQAPPSNGTDPEWNRVRTHDYLTRNTNQQESSGVPAAASQQRIPPPRVPLWEQDRPPTRPTAATSPPVRLMTRPWHIPRTIHDAINPTIPVTVDYVNQRRHFDIYGTKPQGSVGVNTYRTAPRPWDERLLVPAPSDYGSAGRDGSGLWGNRPWRRDNG